jgi:hypothetical protein
VGNTALQEFSAGWVERFGVVPDDGGAHFEGGLGRRIAGPDHDRRSSAVVFLGYETKPGTDAGEYEAFLREEDNPFFNTVDGIVRYENWKVEQTVGRELAWPYFDLMFLEDPAALDRVWGNTALQEFSAGWVERFGVVPDDGGAHFEGGLGRVVAAP